MTTPKWSELDAAFMPLSPSPPEYGGSVAGAAPPPAGGGSQDPLAQLFSPASPSRRIKDRAATILVSICFAIAVIPLFWVLWTVVDKGSSVLFDPAWWTNSQNGVTERREGGGAFHAVIGSLVQTLVAAIISVPIALLGAVYLVEYGRGRLARAVGFMVDILTGIPSIVAALFVYAVVITSLGFQRQGFAVSLALVLLMIPVVLRTTEEMLKLVPHELREASLALGVPKWKTIVRIVVPTALPGIITGIMLGIARVIGETAPLLILVGYSKAINFNLFDGFQGSLPGMIVNESKNIALAPSASRAWGAALTLILIVLVLNLAARLVARATKVSDR
ncbi:MAG: phosphate ABC transporter permease PstA [Sporichthyaceae bacterium]